MDDFNKSVEKKWVEVWQQAGDSLEDVKLKELRASDYYSKNRELLNKMLNYAFENRTIRKSSGLVEQQQVFMRYHEKK